MKPNAHTTPAESGGVRDRILNAAMAILRETGIQGLSQVQVARRAHVRQSHLTYYFPKRHDLIEAVAIRFIDEAVRGLRDVTAGISADDRGATLERIADAITDQGHMRMFIGVIVEADGDVALRSVLVRETLRLQSILAELLGGEDAPERAALVVASLWGVGLYELVIRPEHGSALVPSFLASLA